MDVLHRDGGIIGAERLFGVCWLFVEVQEPNFRVGVRTLLLWEIKVTFGVSLGEGLNPTHW